MTTNDRITLEQFLSIVVSGFLFNDLQGMDSLFPAAGHMGGAGYPMLSSTCAGMELLGKMLSKRSLKVPDRKGVPKPRNGQEFFADYWNDYMAKACPAYAVPGLCDFVYQVARHGLAHTSIPKGNLVVVKAFPEPDIASHLKHDGSSVYIEARQFFLDFRTSYHTRVAPRIAGPNSGSSERDRVEKRLQEILADYENVADAWFKKIQWPADREITTPQYSENYDPRSNPQNT